jgi:hypothetical protein
LDLDKDPSSSIPIDILNTNANYYITSKPAKYEQTTIQPSATSWEQTTYKIKNIDYELTYTPEDITQIVANYRLIDVATDGSHDPHTGKMAFGWVIAIGEIIIAKGKGPAEGHPTLSSAFRAEASGLLAVAKFLQQMISTFKMRIERFKWFFHIDNKALIDRMMVYETNTITGKSTQWPDSDITISAHHYLKNLNVQYLHVKSHQDKYINDTTKLNFPAKLNKIADELARNQRGIMKAPVKRVTGEFCLLSIDGMHITRDLQRWILDTASQIPIRQYLRERHGWNSSVFNTINWDLQYKILSSYDISDQQRILKFAHDWLPTNHRMYREKLSTTQRCPLCHYRTEDNWHMLQCRHPKQRQTIMELKENLVKQADHALLGEIIALAVPECIFDNSWQVDARRYSSNFTRGIQDQNRIGWHHILGGRFATSFSQHESPGSSTAVRKTLKLIWDTVLTLWKQRNDIIHNNTVATKADRQRERMEAKIERCYTYRDHLTVQDRSKIFPKEKAELLKEDPRQIKIWLKMAERIIRVHKREVAKTSREKEMMEQYFKWHPPDRTHNCIRKSAASGSTIQIG